MTTRRALVISALILAATVSFAGPLIAQETPKSGGVLKAAMIGELFRFFLADPSRLPQPYSQQALQEPAHRVVCDYIAGMTDAFFHRTYEQTFGPDS